MYTLPVYMDSRVVQELVDLLQEDQVQAEVLLVVRVLPVTLMADQLLVDQLLEETLYHLPLLLNHLPLPLLLHHHLAPQTIVIVYAKSKTMGYL
jgi:alpha-galactosidase